MRAKLKSITEIAKDIILVEFDTNGQVVNFEPGQFFELTLIKPHFTDERGDTRHFGFVNAPGENSIQIIMKKGISAFKKSLLEMTIGAEVEIDKINGMIDLPEDINQPLVFICGGIGVAPVMSIIKTIKIKDLKYKLTLIYVNEIKEEAIFIQELQTIANENPDFKLILTDKIDTNIINNISDLNINLYFVKGEQKFVIPTINLLKDNGVGLQKIFMEIFTGY